MNTLNFDLQVQLAEYLYHNYQDGFGLLLNINKNIYSALLYTSRKYRTNTIRFALKLSLENSYSENVKILVDIISEYYKRFNINPIHIKLNNYNYLNSLFNSMDNIDDLSKLLFLFNDILIGNTFIDRANYIDVIKNAIIMNKCDLAKFLIDNQHIFVDNNSTIMFNDLLMYNGRDISHFVKNCSNYIFSMPVTSVNQRIGYNSLFKLPTKISDLDKL